MPPRWLSDWLSLATPVVIAHRCKLLQRPPRGAVIPLIFWSMSALRQLRTPEGGNIVETGSGTVFGRRIAAMPKLLEDLQGVGAVLREGQLVREMNYSIQVYQRIRETGPGEVILGAMFIEGSVDYDMIRDSIDLIGAELMCIFRTAE